MKIFLIVAPFKFQHRIGRLIPPGVGFLATVLRAAGHQVSVLDYGAFPFRGDALKRRLRRDRPGMVGISATSSSRFSAIAVSRIVKETLPDCSVVAGGPHFTATAENALRVVPSIDIVARGEGERTIVELAHAVEHHADRALIDGISYRDGSHIHHTRERALIDDLDSLPPLDRTFFEERFYVERIPHLNRPCKTVVASRGCPFSCAFCFSHDKNYRRRSAQNVLNEVEYLLDRYAISTIRFFDLTFTVQRQTVVDFCNEIFRRRLKFDWYCESRVDIDLDLLDLMREAGCYALDFGVESASANVLRAINKRIVPEQAVSFARKCRALGIKTKAFLMVSHPTETRADAEETFEFARRIAPYVSLFEVSATNILPGTAVEARAYQTGWLEKNFSWNEPMDPRKTIAIRRSEPVPLYLEHLSLADIGQLFRKYSMLGLFVVKKISLRIVFEKAWATLFDWDKDMRYTLRWLLEFFCHLARIKSVSRDKDSGSRRVTSGASRRMPA